MFVTIDILKKNGACEQGVRYIEQFYPNGAEMIDIIHDRHIPKELLHWGRAHLTNSAEELSEYCKVCNIIDSESFWYSQNINGSKYVVKSKDIFCCKSVFESEDIKYSSDIIGSENVTDSSQIFYSSMIENCQRIYKSKNVSNSINVCNSTLVVNCKNIMESSDIFNSSEIMDCNSVSDSYFCNNCQNINHCMFCDGLSNAEYCIFNTPVDKTRFEILVKQYNKYLTEELAFVREWPCDLAVNMYIAPTKKFDDWYYPINKNFWKWVRTMPFFDEMLIYRITMLPEILEKQ